MTSALPARPNVVHLRREAKLLLGQLRDRKPASVARLAAYAPGLAVSLSTAQLVVAPEYGFTSWAQLKTLVTRMSASGVRYDAIGHGYSAQQRATSGFARMDPVREAAAVDRLARDLEDGTWDRRHGQLGALPEFDIGLRLIAAEVA